MKTRFFSVILSVAVIAGLMLVPASLPAVPAGVALAANNVTIEVLPATQPVLPGDPFTIEVWVQNPDEMDIYGCQARLDFDNTYFSITGLTGSSLFTYVLSTPPGYNNAAGTIDYDCAMPTPPGTATNASAIKIATISCLALSKEGLTTIDFVYQVSPPRKTMVTLGSTDYLEFGGNMSLMHSGAVLVGTPKFTVNITPQYPLPSPPYPPGAKIAMGGMGIGYNIIWEEGAPVGWDMLVILPTDPFPNTTEWGWGEIIIPAAADIIPGWGFVNYTPEHSILPGDHEMEYPPGSGTMLTYYPYIYVNTALSESVTANFGPLPPAIGVDPESFTGPDEFNTPETFTPENKTLTITNIGGMTLNWNATTDEAWLSVDPVNGSLTTPSPTFGYGSENVTVSANVSGLLAGKYSANITIEGASNVTVPVNMTITTAEFVPNFRTIMVSGNSGKPGETSELYAGETFDVYVNFTAPKTDPADTFNSIGLTDVAPGGWTVTVNKDWNSADGSPIPHPMQIVNAVGNRAEIMLFGPFPEGTQLEVMYQVTVPTTAVPGLNNWSCCLYPNAGAGDAWLEYYFDEKGPYTACIAKDWNVTVTQPGDIVGETREVNSAELADVEVTLYRLTDGIGLREGGDGTADWSTDQSKSGAYSVCLDAGDVGLGTGAIRMTVDPIPVADFSGVSFWVWEPAGTLHGGQFPGAWNIDYPYGDPYIILLLDIDNDGAWDAALIGTESYTESLAPAPLDVTHIGPTPNTWVEMVEGYGFRDYDGSLNSLPGVVTPHEWTAGMEWIPERVPPGDVWRINDVGTIAEWQEWFAGNTTGVTVVAVQIQFGSWLAFPDMAVYVDDITISGTTYDLESSGEVALKGDSDISSPDYIATAYVEGEYSVVANRARFYELDASSDTLMAKAFTVDLTNPALLAAGREFDFEGDYGLIPRAPDLSYALKCINLWKIGCAANSEFNLSPWKAMDVCTAWLNPS